MFLCDKAHAKVGEIGRKYEAALNVHYTLIQLVDEDNLLGDEI